jgi:glycosyltransferase involved in cell wall biosynthesis
MTTRLYSRIAMLGAAPETHGSIAATVDAYRAHGLFKRWPITYIATHGEGTLTQKIALAGRAAREFGALLAEHRRIALHLHVCSGAGFWREAGFMGAALAAGCPVALQLHGNGYDASIRWFLERAAIVCVPCESMRTWVRSVARNATVALVPPPVAVDVPEVAHRPNVVLFLGRLDAAKGIYDLLDAIAAVRATVPDVRLVCAGDGDQVGVARYAERLEIAEAVKFTGRVGPSGKRALLEHAAVFALPSYDEALPLGLLEAMSAGIPVVATKVGGIPEVVVDGASGLLLAPGDKAGLQRSLARVLSDRALANRLGAAARETARVRAAPERALAALEDVYDALGVNGTEERRPRLQVPLRKAA